MRLRGGERKKGGWDQLNLLAPTLKLKVIGTLWGPGELLPAGMLGSKLYKEVRT